VLRLALGSYGGDGLRDLFLIAKVVVADRLHVVIEFIDERLSRRNIETGDVFIADAVEMLDQGAEAVAVSRDQYTLAGGNLRLDRFFPEGNHAGDGVLQTLAGRNLSLGDIRVARILARPHRAVLLQGARADVVGAAPDQNLLFTIFFSGF